MSIIAAGMKDWSPAEWTVFFGAMVTVIGALSAAIVAVIKAGRADAKSDIANERIGNVSRAQDTMRSDLTSVAHRSLPPAEPKPWYPPPHDGPTPGAT